MKIAYCSDLHLNFGSLRLDNTKDAEILILAGDVMEADDPKASPVYAEFFEQISQEFNLIFYVPGNHEYWGGNIRNTLLSMTRFLPANIIMLDNAGYDIHREDGTSVTFFGGTCWTDLGRGNNTSIMYAERMKDFKYTTYSDDKSYFWSKDETGQRVRMQREIQFNTHYWMEEHKLFLEKASERIHGCNDVVMITHHAPSSMSVDPMFKNDIFGNDAYASDLSEFILDRPQIKNWIHGHMHCQNLYMIGDCTVRSNPRGYHGYEKTNEFELKYFDV